MAKTAPDKERLSALKKKVKRPTEPEFSEEEVAKAAGDVVELEEEESREKTPEEQFLDWKKKLQIYLDSQELSSFHLKTKDIGPDGLDFLIYQGSYGNQWARCGVFRKTFYRATLERRLERAGLLPKRNEATFIHS